MTDELKGTVAARVLYMALTLNSETWAPSPGDGDWRWRMTVPVADLAKLAEAAAFPRSVASASRASASQPSAVLISSAIPGVL